MKKQKRKLLRYVPIIVGVVCLVFSAVVRFAAMDNKRGEKIITDVTLTEAVSISELSTAQFLYNGIAEIYKDEKKEKVKCYVRYNAKVKAGIDMKAVTWDIDDDEKTVKPILPPITLNVSIIDDKTLSFIPENTSIELSTALIACKEDSEQEAMKSTELLEVAKDNLKSVIEGLLYPILDSQGYKIIWE